MNISLGDSEIEKCLLGNRVPITLDAEYFQNGKIFLNYFGYFGYNIKEYINRGLNIRNGILSDNLFAPALDDEVHFGVHFNPKYIPFSLGDLSEGAIYLDYLDREDDYFGGCY